MPLKHEDLGLYPQNPGKGRPSNTHLQSQCPHSKARGRTGESLVAYDPVSLVWESVNKETLTQARQSVRTTPKAVLWLPHTGAMAYVSLHT